MSHASSSQEARAEVERTPPRLPAAAVEGALEPSFPVWGLVWRSIVSAVGLWSVVAAPWAGVWFYKWIAERIALPGARGLTLDADVRDAWPLFVAMGLSGWREDGLGDVLDSKAALAVSVLIEAALWAWLVKWFVARLRSKAGTARCGFEGSFLGLAAWTVLFYIGVVSVIGWAWAIKNMLRWIVGRITGPFVVEFHASGSEILWRTVILLLACVPIVSIPWALKRWTNWMVSQFSVR
ncbi:hypothetical protein [Roseiarcus sp.]|uniref:hypothetical protein n=1 Tax=Roseiarcus sp. TaxID=1969460 RepID=UPI003F957D41